MSEDQESQSDEISALQSIFNDEELSVEKNVTFSGQFYAFVPVPNKLLVVYKNLMNYEDELESIQVEHLPPICLYFELPPQYPSVSPPQYKISCPWLSIKYLVYLSMKLEELWQENFGTPILYMWMDFLKNESLACLEITDLLDVRGIFTHDLKSRGRRNINDKRNSDKVKKKQDFWEERKKCWNERKNMRKPLRKRYEKPDKSCHKTTDDMSNPLSSISALNNAQDCENNPKGDNSDKREEEAIKEKFAAAESPQQTSHHCTKPKETFEQAVKNKFDINISRPEFLDKISYNVILKYKDKVDRKRSCSNIIALLVSFNEDRTVSEFKKGFYNCDICFQSQIGAKCIQFKPCCHIYCGECIQSYFAIRVNENTVQTMPCPYDKCSSEASQHQIKEILGEEMYARYDRLLLSATLDMMSDVVYCPRKGCQLPVLIESDRMAFCHACKYAFCGLCHRTYHGVQPCAMKNEEKRKLALSYKEATGAERALLEARYGKQQLVSLLQNVLSTDWISSHSKECPSCRTSIEKSDGCNKMLCAKCNTVFCWLCNKVLDRDAPYKHFYDLKSKCYNQLFLGINDSDDDADIFMPFVVPAFMIEDMDDLLIEDGYDGDFDFYQYEEDLDDFDD